jgi:hypothetical protein
MPPRSSDTSKRKNGGKANFDIINLVHPTNKQVKIVGKAALKNTPSVSTPSIQKQYTFGDMTDSVSKKNNINDEKTEYL